MRTLCFCLKNNENTTGICKYFWGQSFYLRAELGMSLVFAPFSLTRERTINFPGALGPWDFALEIKYLILLCLGWLWTESFLPSKAMSKFIEEKQLTLSIEIKPDSSPLPSPTFAPGILTSLPSQNP